MARAVCIVCQFRDASRSCDGSTIQDPGLRGLVESLRGRLCVCDAPLCSICSRRFAARPGKDFCPSCARMHEGT
jgi:hypothetical protein